MKDLSRIILVLLIFGNNIVKADIYWVSPMGTASWTNAKSVIPLNGINCCNIKTANENAIAGDTAYIRGGVYNSDKFINPKNSGTSWSNQITFSAYNGETVTVTNQKIENHNHEGSAWKAFNGAISSKSNEEFREGNSSTKFIANSTEQGITSEPFLLTFGGYAYSAWVYSTQTEINVSINDSSGSSIYTKDFSIVKNQWVYIKHFFSGLQPGNAVIIFKSPENVTSGTWHIDNVRLCFYQPSIFLNNNIDFIKIHGINFDTVMRGFVIQNGSDNNEISQCNFTNMHMEIYYTSCLIWSNSKEPSRYNWIHHCIIHDNGFVYGNSEEGGCDDRGCPLAVGFTGKGDGSGFNLIENNTFYHNAHDNIIIASKYNTIRNNVFRNEGWMPTYTVDPCGDGDGDASTFNYPDAGFGNRNILIENPKQLGGQNLIENNRIGYAGTPPDDDGANGIENPADANIIRYNFLYGNGTTGYYSKNQTGVADNNKIYNNTFYKNGFGDDINFGYTGGIHYANNKVDQPKLNVIKNNIFYQNSRGPVTATYESVIYIRNTYENNFEADPLFIDMSLNNIESLVLPDLRLQSNSSAIDSGTCLTKVAEEDAGSGTSLIVIDATYFQDGSWAPEGKVDPDWIAVGTVNNMAQISSIDYDANTITLMTPVTRESGDNVWLYKNSNGTIVLQGSAPDMGAYEYSDSNNPQEPNNPKEIQDSTFNIGNIYPNPFNTRTRISYSIQEAGIYKLYIYNFLGQLVKNLFEGELQVGAEEIYWAGENNSGGKVPNGSYILIISSKETRKMAKIVVMK